MSAPFCGRCGVAKGLHPREGCPGFGAPRAEHVRTHLFTVDDGDGSGAEQRADLHLRGNGEHGSGGSLRRMKLADLRAVAEAVKKLVEDMTRDNGGDKP